MSVLIQVQVPSEYCFVVHTRNPVKRDSDDVYIEIACGLGETLASANQSGSPYRLTYNRRTGEVTVIAFSNYSRGLYTNQSGKELRAIPIDYSRTPFSVEPPTLLEIASRIALAALAIESAYQGVP
jgi:phosphoenolpyruvate synthase/pyruvate phosphate dikinase